MSAHDRAALAEALLASLDEDTDDAWAAAAALGVTQPSLSRFGITGWPASLSSG